MKLLLDECVTRHLKRELTGHDVQTVDEAGLKGLKNGDLLRAASGVFDALITVDKNISRQHNLRDLEIAILVLRARKNNYAALLPLIPQTLKALLRVVKREVVEIGDPS